MPTALAIAHELARGPASLGLIRKAMWASLDADFAAQLAFEAVRTRVGRPGHHRKRNTS